MKTIQNVDVITLIWEGPFSYEEALVKESPSVNIGLYQIYGTHGIFGPESLLYIGMTVKDFRDRLKKHEHWIEWESKPVSVYFGRLTDFGTLSSEECKDQICIAEQFLIFFSAPPLNSEHLTPNTWEKIAKRRPTVVINLRRRNRLALEVSNLAEIDQAAPRPVGNEAAGP